MRYVISCGQIPVFPTRAMTTEMETLENFLSSQISMISWTFDTTWPVRLINHLISKLTNSYGQLLKRNFTKYVRKNPITPLLIVFLTFVSFVQYIRKKGQNSKVHLPPFIFCFDLSLFNIVLNSIIYRLIFFIIYYI